MKTDKEVKDAKTAELVAFYNSHQPADKKIKKFADRATAELRVMTLISQLKKAPKERREPDHGTVAQRKVEPEVAPSAAQRIATLLEEGRCPHCAADHSHQTPAGREGEALRDTHAVCAACGVTYNKKTGRALQTTNTEGSDRALAVAASWADPDVAARRAVRDKVLCDGEEHASLAKAFNANGIAMSKLIKFRLELKEKGKGELDGHKFKIVKAKA